MHVVGIIFLFLAAVLPLSLLPVTIFGVQSNVAAFMVVPPTSSPTYNRGELLDLSKA
jgi:hypothetical protein